MSDPNHNSILCCYHVTCASRLNLHAIFGWTLRNYLLQTGAISEVYVTGTGFGSNPAGVTVDYFFVHWSVNE